MNVRILHVLALICFGMNYMSSADVYNDISIELNFTLEDSIRKAVDIAPDSVLLVFKSGTPIEFKSNVDNVTAINDQNIYKLILPVKDGKKSIAISHGYSAFIALNFGMLNESNYQPILKGGDVRAYIVNLYSRVQLIDRTEKLRQGGYKLTPPNSFSNAELEFVSSDTSKQYSFFSSTPVIAIEHLEPAKYKVFISPVKQRIAVYCTGYDTGYIQIDSILPYDWRSYLLNLPENPKQEPVSTIEQKIEKEKQFVLSTLALTSEPSGAKVQCNGYKYDQNVTPFTINSITAGPYSFSFFLDHYKQRDTSITIDNTWETIDTLHVSLFPISDTADVKIPIDITHTFKNDNMKTDEHPQGQLNKKNKFSSKHRLILSSALSVSSVLGGIASNYYAQKKYDYYSSINSINSSDKYNEAWDRVEFYKNSRNAAYIVAGCLAAVFVVDLSLKLHND